MKIAFASCMCTKVYAQQPVWGWIRQQQPDYLVLLGDSIYLDINFPTHPEQMDSNAFSQWQFDLYSELIAQPQFSACVKSLPAGHVFSIWDDHDFLWNDTNGAEALASPMQREKVWISTAYQRAFRTALASQLAGGVFPVSHVLQTNPPTTPIEAPSIQLPHDTWLHLTDGRTFRTRTWMLSAADRTILGATQKNQLINDYQQSSQGSIHLFASGQTMDVYKQSYRVDWDWLIGLAAMRRTLVLSGDIHHNQLDAFYTNGYPLHEATSSGAAVKDAVVIGERRRNFGLLTIDDNTVKVELFSNNSPDTTIPGLPRTYARDSWLPN